MMKGYYTVELQGVGLGRPECIVLETRFARELERALGGHDSTTAICLAAAAHDSNAAQTLRQAHSQAEAVLQQMKSLHGVRFVLRAWQARDL